MSESHEKFAVAFDCWDGRTKRPVQEYAKKHFNADVVDLITEPGMDGFLYNNASGEKVGEWRKKLFSVSLGIHHASPVFVVGHMECAGNPVSEEDHRAHIARACEVVRSWDLPEEVKVVGLLVHNKTGEWEAEEIFS